MISVALFIIHFSKIDVEDYVENLIRYNELSENLVKMVRYRLPNDFLYVVFVANVGRNEFCWLTTSSSMRCLR